jgi:hypothetical protein
MGGGGGKRAKADAFDSARRRREGECYKPSYASSIGSPRRQRNSERSRDMSSAKLCICGVFGLLILQRLDSKTSAVAVRLPRQDAHHVACCCETAVQGQAKPSACGAVIAAWLIRSVDCHWAWTELCLSVIAVACMSRPFIWPSALYFQSRAYRQFCGLSFAGYVEYIVHRLRRLLAFACC